MPRVGLRQFGASKRCPCLTLPVHIDCSDRCSTCGTPEESVADMQRLGSPDAAGGCPMDGLGGGGAFLASTLPNLAMSVPLAELRLRQQRRERADAEPPRGRRPPQVPPPRWSRSVEQSDVVLQMPDPRTTNSYRQSDMLCTEI